ncbi:MAG: PDZ domain-containing protein [Candidatus Zixiibacteriota bacterium]
MKRDFMVTLLFLVFFSCLGMAQDTNEARLLRFPDVSRDNITFIYAGDIYVAPRGGGQAIRITSHEGYEFFPKFSPDGKMIAFGGKYDGDYSVYVIPTGGGSPKRLTFHPGIQNTSERFGPENIVMGWSKDSSKVLFRSRAESMTWWDGRAYLVDTSGGLPRPLPMAVAGFTSFSPDSKKVAYCPIYRDFRTWKRYKGGMAQDIWIYDLENNSSEKITDWVGTDNMPMWYGDKIYFNSDRTGTLNIFCYDTKTKETRQVTKFTEYDVRWPSLGDNAIAFENGGYIHLLELPAEQLRKVTVNLITDHHTVRPEFVKLADRVSDFDIAPDGKRGLFVARGELFTVPAKEGETRNLTGQTSGARESAARWSPDGKWISYISDENGEGEIYLVATNGKEKVRLTNDGHCRRFTPEWSPDSKMLVFSDKELNLYYIDIASRKTTRIDKSERNEIRNYVWSPDSKFLAYNKTLDNNIMAIFVYSFADGKVRQITPGFTNDYAPAFDPEGKYLYFLSERNFNPMLGSYEFFSINNAITNLYLILLSADEKSPFEPKEEEAVEEKKDEKPKEGKKGGKEESPEEKPVEVKIDFEGIYSRQVAFDLPAGEYDGIAAIKGAVFYFSFPLSGLKGRIGKDETVLHKYDLKEKKDSDFAVGLNNYSLTAKGDKIMIRKGNDFFITETGGKKADLEEKRVDLSRMEMKVDHLVEYNQMYKEAWRLQRDYFYDPNMHGVDWKKMHDRYAAMLPFVQHRYDLTYLIGEMIGELCCSHTYTGGGEMPQVRPSRIGLLGVDFEVDEASNRIKIARILQGENWDEQLRSPLRDPGVNVKEGEYLLAINGLPITGDIDPYSLTENMVGKKITLTVNNRPDMTGAREVTVKPIAEEEILRYYNWVEERRRYVDSVSGGKIGYLHIPDMDTFGLVRFMKMFYHQIRKEGLIIDVRYNGGGFVSTLILQRLRQELRAMGASRNFKEAPRGIYAHMITLTNEFSCSDGDYFPYFFREYKLGPLMGKRTWGGVVGIRGFPSLLDGGYCTVPEFSIYDLKGNWIMENVGVVPDMEVENLPERLVAGYDDQLLQALEYLNKKIKEEPHILPPRPAPPTPR